MKKLSLFLAATLILTMLSSCTGYAQEILATLTSGNGHTQSIPVLMDFEAFTPHFNEEYIVLEKSPDEDFIVLNLTDPQLDTNEWDEDDIERKILEYTIDELIKKTQPDLITISGDLSWGKNCHKSYKMFAELLEKYDIPWAPVWGNHDNEDGVYVVDSIEKLYSRYENCIYKEGEPELGSGNYVISIEENGTPITAIFMIDSHDHDTYIDANGNEYEDYSKLNDEQINWYKLRAESLKSLGYQDSAIVLHIPIHGYRTAFNAAFNSEYDSTSISWEESYDDKYWNAGYENSSGLNNEGIWSSPVEDGMRELIENIGNTKCIIAGHDHKNNFIINYNDVYYVYGLKTGMGCYWDQKLNGGTIVRISSNGIEEVYHEYINVDHILNAQ